MKENIPMKYSCVDRMQQILNNCKDDEASKLIIELYDLVVYQRNMIKEQRIEIIAEKHKKAWIHYERPLEQYDNSKRTYVDKPPKSDNMSC